MKKQFTLAIAILTMFSLSISAQFGPGPFDTYLKTFEDGNKDGYVSLFAPNEWIVNENPRTARNELHWVRPTSFNIGYMFGGYGIIYDGADFENYTLSVKITSTWNNRIGVLFNFKDSANFHSFHFNPNANRRLAQVFELEDGVPNAGSHEQGLILRHLPDQLPTEEENKSFYFKVRNQDGKSTGWLNGICLFNNLPMPKYEFGKIGVYGLSNNDMWVDSIKVESNFGKASSNATLSSLTASVGEMTPEFGPNVINYTLSVPDGTTEVTLTAQADDGAATVEGAGAVTEVPSSRVITVTAADGTEYSYTVNIETAVGLSQRAADVFTIYPNPASDNVRISLKKDATVTVSSIVGAKIMEVYSSDRMLELNISDLNPGVYYITVDDGNGRYSQKLLKR